MIGAALTCHVLFICIHFVTIMPLIRGLAEYSNGLCLGSETFTLTYVVRSCCHPGCNLSFFFFCFCQYALFVLGSRVRLCICLGLIHVPRLHSPHIIHAHHRKSLCLKPMINMVLHPPINLCH